jgi:phospholipid/cholesterol/gamma-HCH transport system substrate-binding protein
MKDNKNLANIKLGILVIFGLLFLVFSLYMIGKNQNIFGRSFMVKAEVKNVNGLVVGNNVRFQGLDIGTVKSIEMVNDSTIHISMLIRNSMQSFIKKNAQTTINTDGLMGNKLVQIHPQKEYAPEIKEGDLLYPAPQLDTDAMLKKLDQSSVYFEQTLANLAQITEKINESEAIWDLLADANLTLDIQGAAREFKKASINANQMTKAGKDLLLKLEQGDGIVQAMFTDTVMNQNLQKSLIEVRQTSQDAAKVMEEMRALMLEIKQGGGTAGLVLTDSAFRESTIRSIQNIEKSAFNFNQNMEAIQNSFLFRRYFRKKEAEEKPQK